MLLVLVLCLAFYIKDTLAELKLAFEQTYGANETEGTVNLATMALYPLTDLDDRLVVVQPDAAPKEGARRDDTVGWQLVKGLCFVAGRSLKPLGQTGDHSPTNDDGQ